MKKLKTSQAGFIPMMICILAVIVAIIYFAYHHVQQAQH
jgi:hypothetical protein